MNAVAFSPLRECRSPDRAVAFVLRLLGLRPRLSRVLFAPVQRTNTMTAPPPRLFVATGLAGSIESPAPVQVSVAGPEKSAARELPRMLSTAEVAEMFGRAPRTIRSWIERGLLQPVKVGNSVFIPQPQIETLLSPTEPMQSCRRQYRKAPVI